jgi:hypothetical protein
MSNYFRIIDQCPDGATLGDSSNAKWAAHGATPCGQQTAPTALTPATDTTSTISTAVNLIRTALVNKGIIA